MNYSIKVTEVNFEDSKVKAYASLVFENCFKIGNISILEGKDGTEFVSMPRYKTNQTDDQGRAVYQDICFPITKEFRDKLYGDIMEAYRAEKNRDKSQAKSEAESKDEPKTKAGEKTADKAANDTLDKASNKGTEPKQIEDAAPELEPEAEKPKSKGRK